MKKLTNEEMRERLLYLIRTTAPIERRWLRRQFADGPQFNAVLGRLFFDGYIVSVGLGRRNDPEMILERQPYIPGPPEDANQKRIRELELALLDEKQVSATHKKEIESLKETITGLKKQLRKEPKDVQ